MNGSAWFLVQKQVTLGEITAEPGDRIVVWDHPTHPVGVLRASAAARSEVLLALERLELLPLSPRAASHVAAPAVPAPAPLRLVR